MCYLNPITQAGWMVGTIDRLESTTNTGSQPLHIKVSIHQHQSASHYPRRDNGHDVRRFTRFSAAC